ncbi:MAG: hypothetical protein FWD55_08315 [Propionibacteriaceae bacterium]|nr:hypothetical protein [Propionibacteriaceae bacterium]
MNATQWNKSAQVAHEATERAASTADPSLAIADLAEASRAIEGALQEAMAAAVLAGVSMRKVAEIAGMAPNSVPSRLARSTPLSGYTSGGTVTADMIAVARHDAATGRGPMTFTPRRKD